MALSSQSLLKQLLDILWYDTLTLAPFGLCVDESIHEFFVLSYWHLLIV